MAGVSTWARIAVVACSVAICSVTAVADDSVREVHALIDQFGTAVDERKFVEAAELLGDAAALAHTNGLLQEEAYIAGNVRMLIFAVTPGSSVGRRLRAGSAPAAAAAGPLPTPNDILVTLLGRLDPARPGAFVSPHALAMQIVITGTTTGTPALVGVASDTLARFADASGSGSAAKMWADYARGLAIVENHIAERAELVDAVRPLELALDRCVKEGWQEPAMYVGTELACVRMDLRRPDEARAALEGVMRLFSTADDQLILFAWRAFGDRRLAGLTAKARLPYTAAIEPVAAGFTFPDLVREVGAPHPSEKLVDAWPRLRQTKVFVTARRRKDEFDFRHTFGRNRLRLAEPYRAGARTVHLGGVGFVVHAQAVAPAYVNPTGGRGSGTSGPSRSTSHAWYYLARGEKLSITRGGRVVISK